MRGSDDKQRAWNMYRPCLNKCFVVVLLFFQVAANCKDKNISAPKGNTTGPANAQAGPSVEPAYAKIWNRHDFDHSLWDRVLRKYVDDRGGVDYAGIGESAPFREYLYRLSKTDAAELGDDHQRLAFWINAYNALTIHAVLETLPKDRAAWPAYSIRDQKIDGKDIWNGMVFSVGEGRWTLNQIEHEILRKRDGLRDPRIHVALVCGARGCPPLWNRAYTGKAIDDQLAEAVRRFITNPRQCLIDPKKELIRISKVFEWYAADFTNPKFSPHAESIPAFLALWTKDPALTKALKSRTWRMEYFDYDWKLNLQSPPN